MSSLVLVGVNHKTAAISAREKLSISTSELPKALERFRAVCHVREAVILSTCNRTELYTVALAAEENGSGIFPLVREFYGLAPSDPVSGFYSKRGQEAVRHLFQVAGGLDSMILGENQILGQVKQAFQTAQQEKTVGTLLHRLFQSALEAGKRIRRETSLGKNPGSVGEAAVELAKHIFGSLPGKSVLVIGLGEMGSLVLESLQKSGVSRFFLCNRTLAAAQQAAEKFHGTAYPLEEIRIPLRQTDMVIASTGSSTPLLTKIQLEPIMRDRRHAPLFVIDIAVPRDVEESAGELENLFLYNIDDLNRIVEKSNHQLESEAGKAREILEEELLKFQTWSETLEIVPLVKSLVKRMERVKSEEIEKILSKNRNMSESERVRLENLAHNLVNKMLHHPLVELKNFSSHPLRFDYVEVARTLFGLESEES